MAGTRRFGGDNISPQPPPLRKRTKHTTNVTPCEGRRLREYISQVSEELLINYFLRIWPHIWYLALPSEGGHSDISGRTKQK